MIPCFVKSCILAHSSAAVRLCGLTRTQGPQCRQMELQSPFLLWTRRTAQKEEPKVAAFAGKIRTDGCCFLGVDSETGEGMKACRFLPAPPPGRASLRSFCDRNGFWTDLSLSVAWHLILKSSKRMYFMRFLLGCHPISATQFVNPDRPPPPELPPYTCVWNRQCHIFLTPSPCAMNPSPMNRWLPDVDCHLCSKHISSESPYAQ